MGGEREGERLGVHLFTSWRSRDDHVLIQLKRKKPANGLDVVACVFFHVLSATFVNAPLSSAALINRFLSLSFSVDGLKHFLPRSECGQLRRCRTCPPPLQSGIQRNFGKEICGFHICSSFFPKVSIEKFIFKLL